jgi:hypothetical protein
MATPNWASGGSRADGSRCARLPEGHIVVCGGAGDEHSFLAHRAHCEPQYLGSQNLGSGNIWGQSSNWSRPRLVFGGRPAEGKNWGQMKNELKRTPSMRQEKWGQVALVRC